MGNVSPFWASGPFAKRAIDIKIGLAEHAGGREDRHRIASNTEPILAADFHHYFDGRQGLALNDANSGDVADVNAGEANGGADAEPAGVIEVAFKDNLAE